MRLYFNALDVQRIFEHSKASKAWRDGYGGKNTEAKLCLVHDQGVYLMSAGVPRLINPDDGRKEHESFCAYAAKCNPHIDDEWWDACRDAVGGDDFSDYLPLSFFSGVMTQALKKPRMMPRKKNFARL